ncbi:CapA family protein, partial [Intestinimonas butyriciproducens]|uniref:CapA family protein n=1 Tax=Intestinimonas butyriciproducens TaxID=1297617 RepID=UPI00195ECDB9
MWLITSPHTATLAVCGDVMSHMPVTNDAWDEAQGIYDYTPIFEAARPYVEGADYAVANLETTLSTEGPYSGYPAFRSPSALAGDLRELGFDLMLTANNHCLDRRYDGLVSTLDHLDQAGLAHVGTARTAEESGAANIHVADVGGISVAFLGYTYGTNGIPLPSGKEYAVNLFNTDYMTTLSTPDTQRLEADLAAARALDTDLIAVMIHWGVEYQTTQNSYQEELADLLIANGADLVLGGHSHVPQPIETRTVTAADGTQRTGFVCYSLGNFISSQVDPLTDTTAVLTLELTLDHETGEAGVTGWSYAPMLMVRRDGTERVFTLTDASSLPVGASDDLTRALEEAAANCAAILGPATGP